MNISPEVYESMRRQPGRYPAGTRGYLEIASAAAAGFAAMTLWHGFNAASSYLDEGVANATHNPPDIAYLEGDQVAYAAATSVIETDRAEHWQSAVAYSFATIAAHASMVYARRPETDEDLAFRQFSRTIT